MKKFEEVKKEFRDVIRNKHSYKMSLKSMLRESLRANQFSDSYYVYMELEQDGEMWTELHENVSLGDFEQIYSNTSAQITHMEVVHFIGYNIEKLIDIVYEHSYTKLKKEYREGYIKLLSNSTYGKEILVNEGDLPF